VNKARYTGSGDNQSASKKAIAPAHGLITLLLAAQIQLPYVLCTQYSNQVLAGYTSLRDRWPPCHDPFSPDGPSDSVAGVRFGMALWSAGRIPACTHPGLYIVPLWSCPTILRCSTTVPYLSLAWVTTGRQTAKPSSPQQQLLSSLPGESPPLPTLSNSLSPLHDLLLPSSSPSSLPHSPSSPPSVGGLDTSSIGLTSPRLSYVTVDIFHEVHRTLRRISHPTLSTTHAAILHSRPWHRWHSYSLSDHLVLSESCAAT
jgi:hypothetical protein